MQKVKRINVTFDDTLGYMRIVNGLFNLTEFEMRVLAHIIDLDIPSEMDRFSTDVKRTVAIKMGIPSTQMNMYIKKLVKKGAIGPKPYSIHSALIPSNKIELICQKN